MTKLVSLSGVLDKNPGQFGDLERGMLFWAQFAKEYPNFTFHDLHKLSIKKKYNLGGWWTDLKNTAADLGNYIGDKAGDAVRLLFLEESDSGKTIIGQGVDAAASLYSGGGSTLLKDQGESGDIMQQLMSFFKASGKGLSEIETGSIRPGNQMVSGIKNEHLLIGAIGFLGLIVLLK